MIRAAVAFHFPPTARPLLLGRMVTTATALPPVTFVFTHGIALQVLGNSKALTSTAKRRMIIAALAFPFPPTARPLPLGRHRLGSGSSSGHVRVYSFSCPQIVEGCTDENAANYNPEANVDDGSCIIYGCPFANACNYDPDATQR